MRFDVRLAVFATVLGIGAQAAPVSAQQSGTGAYPVKPIRLIVPLAPGGPSDILGRAMAQKLTEVMKQTVFVDNRPGAGGTLGADITAKSPPDGYTMILVSTSYAINASLYPKLPYDTLKDLAPVTMLASAPYIFAVHPALPVRSMKELIALAKSRPGQLNYASGGSGTGPHMAMELLKLKTGINIVHIPYKGAGPALIDLIAGHVQAQCVNMIAGLPHVKSGKLRALAVSTARRSAAAPDIPSVADAVPGFDESGQHGIMVPAGTPREIVARLNQEIVRVLQSPEVRDRLAGEGAAIVGNTPEQFAAVIRSDVEKWAKLIKSLGITAN